jgi:hypothetical protein
MDDFPYGVGADYTLSHSARTPGLDVFRKHITNKDLAWVLAVKIMGDGQGLPRQVSSCRSWRHPKIHTFWRMLEWEEL